MMVLIQGGRRRVQTSPIGLTGCDGFLHCVVDVKDGTLGAVLAITLLVFAPHDWKGVHDI